MGSSFLCCYHLRYSNPCLVTKLLYGASACSLIIEWGPPARLLSVSQHLHPGGGLPYLQMQIQPSPSFFSSLVLSLVGRKRLSAKWNGLVESSSGAQLLPHLDPSCSAFSSTGEGVTKLSAFRASSLSLPASCLWLLVYTTITLSGIRRGNVISQT